MPWCAFSIDCLLTVVFCCYWDLSIGVRVQLWKVSGYGRFSIQSFLKGWPGPQTGVHLGEVSASGGSTVFNLNIRGFASYTGKSTSHSRCSEEMGEKGWYN